MNSQAKIEDALHELDKAVFDGAIVAERERCAQLVETFPDNILVLVPHPGKPPSSFYRKSTQQDIADAIRARKD